MGTLTVVVVANAYNGYKMSSDEFIGLMIYFFFSYSFYSPFKDFAVSNVSRYIFLLQLTSVTRAHFSSAYPPRAFAQDGLLSLIQLSIEVWYATCLLHASHFWYNRFNIICLPLIYFLGPTRYVGVLCFRTPSTCPPRRPLACLGHSLDRNSDYK